MPRVTNAQAAARRAQVAELWVRGAPLAGIARTLGVDWETVKRDVVVLGAQAVKETDVARELARLLLGGRAAETAGWTARDLGLVLSAQRQQLAVLAALQGLDVERRLAALEARVASTAGAQGGRPWAA